MPDNDEGKTSQNIALLTQAVEGLEATHERQGERIEQVSRESQRMFNDSTKLMERQSQDFRSDMKALGVAFSSKIDGLTSRMGEVGRPNWALILTAIFGSLALLFTLVGGGYVIVKLQTENTVAPVISDARLASNQNAVQDAAIKLIGGDVSKLRADLDTNSGRDERSEQDRSKLNQRTDKLEDTTAKAEAQRQVLGARLTEVETQFRGIDNINNLRAAENLRWFSVIYEKAFPGSRFPSQVQFYPKMTDGASLAQ